MPGCRPSHPALQSAARWVLAEEIRGPGDWQVRRPGLAPAGWAFEFDNDGYPDIDDTAEVRARARAGWRSRRGDRPAGGRRGRPRALHWLVGMQSADGGWGAFDADNTSRLVTKLPFCDFGAVIDPPSADVTAHTVEALAAAGLARQPSRSGAASPGCCARRSQTARGSAAGAPTTCTAQAPSFRRSSRLACCRRSHASGVP